MNPCLTVQKFQDLLEALGIQSIELQLLLNFRLHRIADEGKLLAKRLRKCIQTILKI